MLDNTEGAIKNKCQTIPKGQSKIKLDNTEGTNKNGQSRETGHQEEDKQKQQQKQ